jgi:LmbE family N-acetylglucosaminyl deacetylase
MTTRFSHVQLEAFCGNSAGHPAPRTLIIAAHPDDEVIGAGSRLRYLPDVTFMHVTDGSPGNLDDARACGLTTREAYANLRRNELETMLALIGVAAQRAECLGVIDQEASMHMPEIARAIADRVATLQPDVILTHPYEGGHPDHDATALATHVALNLLTRARTAIPALLEFASYYARDGRFAPLEFLPAAGGEVAIRLSSVEETLKRSLVDCYRSQRNTLALFPLDIERFRVAPSYDFTCAPHAGALYYERFDWGMTGERFRSLARDALGCFDLQDLACV